MVKMHNILKHVQVVLEAQECNKMEILKRSLSSLPWRIIKTTISVIVAIAILPSISYVLFKMLFPVYPFVFETNHGLMYIGTTSTALYFTAMAATKGVGNTLTSTWKAISSQMISNFFGAVMGVVISSTLAEMWGPTNPFTIGIGIFILYLILKHLQLNDAFTLGGITFITIVILSSADYPPLVRGVDRFYSMAIGLIVSGIINIIFLSPKKSPQKLFEQLKSIERLFCLQNELSQKDYTFIESELAKIQKDTTILMKDEKIEKRVFFLRHRQGEFERKLLNQYVKQSQLLMKIDSLINTSKQENADMTRMYQQLKMQHYEMLINKSEKETPQLLKGMREWLFLHHEQVEEFDIVQFLDCLNQYEQLLTEE